jgi:arylsulfatase A-like enzyme
MRLLAWVATGTFLAVAAARAAAQAPVTAADGRTNVILLMVDDLDVASLDAAVAAGYMPNFVEQVVSPGTTFSESFVTLSLCCPSRSTLLTGQYPHNHGVIRNSGAFGGFHRFDDRSTLATWLRDGGYHTGHVGKYLNGYADAAYVPPGWDDWQALVDPSTYCMYDYTISDNGVPVAYGAAEADYQTDVLAGRADDFIREWHEQGDPRPFYLSITPLAPHVESACRNGVRPAPRHLGTPRLPLPRPPSFNEQRMGDKPTWMRGLPLLRPAAVENVYNQRIAALRAVDDLIGTLGRRLEVVGAASRTAFIFTSDNGYLLGQHRWRSKVLLYEESIRVPLIVRVPGAGQPPRVEEIALNNDLAPTIAALAGVEPGLAVDGRSLLPLLEGESPRWRRRFLVEFPPADESAGIPPFFAVRTARDPEGGPLVYGETWDFSGARITDREQYDLALDPLQLRSLHRHLSPLRVEQRRVLSVQLQQLKTCGGGSCQAIEE